MCSGWRVCPLLRCVFSIKSDRIQIIKKQKNNKYNLEGSNEVSQPYYRWRAFFFGVSCPVLADDMPDWNQQTLTGGWGGTRDYLYGRGIDIGANHKSDLLSDVSGGLKRGSEWEGNTDIHVVMDLDKLLGWDSTTVYVLYHSELGAKFNRNEVGGFNGEDNDEVAENTAQFFNVWIQKNLFKDSLSLKAGIYPIDSEFYVTDTSAVFLQPPYGMANEFSQAGKNGPPVFPLGTPAVRVKVSSPNKDFYAMAALTNGMPGNPNSHNGTQIIIDGSLKVVELGYTPQPAATAMDAQNQGQEEAETFNKTAIGYWRFSSRFNDLTDVDAAGNPLRRDSQGAYFLTEHSLYMEPGHPAQGLSGFFRIGFASADINRVDWTSSAGLRYHGLIPGRDDDIAGLAVTINHASDKFQVLHNTESRETDFELTYRAQIKPWLALQPDLQLIMDPGMSASIGDAWVLGLRTEVAF
jgi:porin